MNSMNINKCVIEENNHLLLEFFYSGETPIDTEITITDLENMLPVYKTRFKELVPNINYWVSLPPMLALRLGKVRVEFSPQNLFYLYDFNRPTLFTIRGKKFLPKTSGDVSFVTFLEVMEEEVYNRGNVKVDEGDVVLDIGANYGFFSLYSVERGASKVISMEPFPKTYECLRDNVESFPEILTINKAISDKEGTFEFVSDPNYCGANYLLSNSSISEDNIFIKPGDDNVFTVETTTINQVIEDYGLDRIDFLKVDCEGGELDLLKTISDENLLKVRKTVVEYHSKEIGEFVKSKLEDSGMEFYDLQPIEKMGLIYAYRPEEKPIRIGVLLSAYNSEDYIDECLQPWMSLKEEFDITFACVSGMYKEYLDFGFRSKNKGTLSKLINYDLDFLLSTGEKSLLDENGSKNSALDALKNNCDLVWILDSDEFYTEEDIKNILEFIKKNKKYDWYSVNLKNSTFEKKLWIDGFCPPRIFRTDRNRGISHFYFDNHITYNDGENFDNKPNIKIPRSVAWVKHYSWLNEDSRSREKIKYQDRRFVSGCSFTFNEVNGKIYFSDRFYKERGIEEPILHETLDFLSREFTVNFVRRDNTFYIENVEKSQDVKFKFFNDNKGVLIQETNLSLYKGVNFYCSLPGQNYWETEGFSRFRVEAFIGEEKIHSEIIHIKYK
jgi:FkbM family methyltransferase